VITSGFDYFLGWGGGEGSSFRYCNRRIIKIWGSGVLPPNPHDTNILMKLWPKGPFIKDVRSKVGVGHKQDVHKRKIIGVGNARQTPPPPVHRRPDNKIFGVSDVYVRFDPDVDQIGVFVRNKKNIVYF